MRLLSIQEKKTITILCPVFNESENVEDFYSRFMEVLPPLLNAYKFDFLFADNCSTDDTFEKLKLMHECNGNVRIIKYSRNFGVMKSIYTGIINTQSDAVAVFDCDLQDPPELLPEFIREWEKGAKIAYGIRRTRDEHVILNVLRRIYRKIESFFKSYEIEIESGAWLIDSRVVDELRKNKRFEPYLAGLIGRLGFQTAGIPYDRKRRLKGHSKFPLHSYFSYATDGLVSGTVAPLRISIIAGAFFSLASFLVAIYFIIARFFLDAPFASGVAAAIVIVLFGFGLNFIFLGIIGEYIGRLYLERETSEPAIIDEKIDY